MKRLLLTLAAAGLFGCYLPAQTITAAVIDKKMSDGTFAEAEVPLEANSLLGFDGSKNPVRVAIGDNLTLSGSPLTLAAAAGGGTWGTITGTLSAQTDLQTALNAKLNSSAVSAFGLTLIDDADAAAARTTLGLGTLATQSANIGDYLTSATAASTYAALAGSYADPAWITSLAWSKITGTPTSLGGYGITDTEWIGTVLGENNGGSLSMGSASNWSSSGDVQTSSGSDASGQAEDAGGSGGSFLAFGGDGAMQEENAATGGAAGSVRTYGGGAVATSGGAWAGGAGGSIHTYGGHASDGSAGLAGGSIITHTGGGSINTRGTGSIELGSNGTRTTIVGAAASNWTLTTPTGPGTNGQVLTTDGTGTTSWTTVGGSGTVTSVAVAGTDGLEVDSGSPITGAGTITLGVNASTLKTHLALGNVENTALSTWAGSANLTTLGTIASGTWQGSIIAPAYLGTGSDITTKYLRGDGTWQTVAGGGIGGSTGSTDNAILRADGTGGSTAQASLVTIDDDGIIDTPNGLTTTGNVQAAQVLLKKPAAANAVIITPDVDTDAWTFSLPLTAGSEGKVLLNTGGGVTTWGNVEWDDIDKTGSSLADLATRSAGDLTSGTLDAARLPAPTTTTLGGVKRNTGTGGQFVNGIDSAGALTYGTPAGAAVEIGVACSDETTDLTTGSAKVTFRMPHGMTLTGVRASVTTASAGSTIIVNIKEGGTTVLGTKLSIDASERTSTTAASSATITDSTLADDAEMTIDIDQVGSSTAGTGLKVWLIGTRN